MKMRLGLLHKSRTVLLVLLVFSGAASAELNPPGLVGINVAGAAFAGNILPGKRGTNYFFPPENYLAMWKERGIRWIRFSIQWERLQPQQFGPLDEDYAQRIDAVLEDANANGIKVLFDVHNYGRYYSQIVGTDAVPIAAYSDLMEKIASRWSGNDTIFAYDIMNEPYGDAHKYWFDVAQAGINAVRKYDSDKDIYIEGRFWSSSLYWAKYNDDLLGLVDPQNKIVFSAHIYADKDSSGLYKEKLSRPYDPMLVVKRAKPFVDWLIKNKRKGHFGEYGVPADDAGWLEMTDNFLAYLRTNCIPLSFWAAGPAWGKHPLSIEPASGVDKPQWGTLKKYLGDGGCTAIGPKF